MPNKNKKTNTAPPALKIATKNDKPRRGKRQPSKSAVAGSGMYSLIGPLAKAAIQAALPGMLSKIKIPPSAVRISGSGDYVTNDIVHASNSLPEKKGSAGVPMTKYTHSEYVADLLAPTTPANFTSVQYTLNAADSATFPWLSRLAALYTKYRFTKLLFEFRSNTSNFATGGALGTVIMAPQYNPTALPFTSKQLMEAATHAVSSAPSNSVLMGFECSPKDANVKWYNVLNDSTTQRGVFTDPGIVTIATNGLPATAGQSLGEIWVHYTCELIEPYISVTDAISTSFNAGTGGFYQSASNLASSMAAGFMGFQYSALVPASATVLGVPTANWLQGVVSTTVPSTATHPNWSFYCSGDAGKALGFRYAGTYMLIIEQRQSVTGTASTGAPWDLSATAGSLTSITGNNAAALATNWTSPTPAFGYVYVVTVTAGTVLTSSLNAGWTGYTGSATLNTLTIVRLS